MILGINHTVVLKGPKLCEDEQWDAVCRYDKSDAHSSDDEERPVDEAGMWLQYGRWCKKVEGFSTPGHKYGKYGRDYSTQKSAESTQDSSPVVGSMPHAAGDGATVPSAPPPSPSPRLERDHGQTRTDDSTRTGDSTTTNDATGFAFFQLGALHSRTTFPFPPTTDAAAAALSPHAWHRTDYVVVAQIEQTGELRAIWVLWNFWAGHDGDERVWCGPFIHFPGTDEYITGARTAGSFAELGPKHEVCIPSADGLHFTEDFELVGCYRLLAEGGRIVKQWVVDASSSPQGDGA